MYNLYFPQIICKLQTCSTVLHLPLNPRRHSSRCDSKTFCNFIFKIVNKTLTGMAEKTYRYRAMVLLFQTGFFGTSIKIIDLVHFSGHLPFSSILLQILKIFMTLLPPYFRSSLDMLSILGALIFLHSTLHFQLRRRVLQALFHSVPPVSSILSAVALLSLFCNCTAPDNSFHLFNASPA